MEDLLSEIRKFEVHLEPERFLHPHLYPGQLLALGEYSGKRRRTPGMEACRNQLLCICPSGQ